MSVFNGVELLIPNEIALQIAGDACPSGMGSWNPNTSEYFSCRFPFEFMHLPIHIKEFLCVIVAVKIWGHQWSGKCIEIFCDNDAVCEVITNQKPKDSNMQSYLREFLFYVCKFNFRPVVSKIASKENDIADFISRNYDPDDAHNFFYQQNIPSLRLIELTSDLFEFKAEW